MAGTDSNAAAERTMPQTVHTEDVLGGDPRIEGHRIAVVHVYQRYVDGDETPEAIAASYDISVNEVHAALASAFSNPDEMREVAARHQARYEAADEHRIGPDVVS